MLNSTQDQVEDEVSLLVRMTMWPCGRVAGLLGELVNVPKIGE